MKYFSLLIVFLLNLQAIQAQEYENDSILIWNGNRQLTWDDFLSKNIKLEMVDDAELTLSISIFPKKINCENVKNIHIITLAKKNKSSVRVESCGVLKHERTHFNIAELFTRKMRKSMEDFKERDTCNLQDIVDLHKRIDNKNLQTQLLYDKETNHSKNIVEQKKWDRKIDSLLQVYKDYERNYTIEDLEEE